VRDDGWSHGRGDGLRNRLLNRSARVRVARPAVGLGVVVVTSLGIAGLVVGVAVLCVLLGVLVVAVVIAVGVVAGSPGALFLEPTDEQVEARDRGEPDPEETDHTRDVPTEEERRR
jgi:uncharacterized protein involved in cysteine biosynthesis